VTQQRRQHQRTSRSVPTRVVDPAPSPLLLWCHVVDLDERNVFELRACQRDVDGPTRIVE